MNENIDHHKGFAEEWSNKINLKNMANIRYVDIVFIHLDLYLYPKTVRIMEEEKIEKVKLIEFISNLDHNVIILGQPGSGKTTSIKYFLHSIKKSKKNTLLVLVRNCDYNNIETQNDIIFPYINLIFGINEYDTICAKIIKENREKISKEKLNDINILYSEYKKRLCKIIDKLFHYIIIEGVDEAPKEVYRQRIYYEINEMSQHLTKTKLIVTTRTGTTIDASSDILKQYEIAPLDICQQQTFIKKWLNNENMFRKFSEQITSFPYSDSLDKPLTLVTLCVIFERLGYIPPTPKTLYKKIVMLYLEDWNIENALKRNTKYAGFEPERKFEYLTRLAYELTVSYHRTIFDDNAIFNIYNKICDIYQLPISEGKQVSKEIESHTGLLVQTGNSFYEFDHKSTQEYLTAEYISRTPEFNFTLSQIELLPNEFAIATSLASNPNEYFCMFINKLERIYNFHIRQSFLITYLSRLYIEKIVFVDTIEDDGKILVSFLKVYCSFINLKELGYSKIIKEYNFKSIEMFFYKLIDKLNFKKLYDMYKVDRVDEFIVLHKMNYSANENDFPLTLYGRYNFFYN